MDCRQMILVRVKICNVFSFGRLRWRFAATNTTKIEDEKKENEIVIYKRKFESKKKGEKKKLNEKSSKKEPFRKHRI